MIVLTLDITRLPHITLVYLYTHLMLRKQVYVLLLEGMIQDRNDNTNESNMNKT